MTLTARLGSRFAAPGNVTPGFIDQSGTVSLTWIGPFDPAELMENGLPIFAGVRRGVPFVVPTAQAAQVLRSDPGWWEQT